MLVDRQIIYENTKNIVLSMYNLDSVEKIEIKEINIDINNIDSQLLEGIEKCIHDKYSDIDIYVYFKIKTKINLEQIGIYSDNVMGIRLEQNMENNVIRFIDKNGIRYDIVLFNTNNSQIFSQIKSINKEILFIIVLALGKLMRGDYLLASHLAHMMIQESIVEQMIERDNKKNTNFHRYGEKEELNYNTVFEALELRYCKGDNTYNHIAKMIISSIQSINKINEKERKFIYELWDFYDEDKNNCIS